MYTVRKCRLISGSRSAKICVLYTCTKRRRTEARVREVGGGGVRGGLSTHLSLAQRLDPPYTVIGASPT